MKSNNQDVFVDFVKRHSLGVKELDSDKNLILLREALSKLDFTKMTEEELKSLGFGRWQSVSDGIEGMRHAFIKNTLGKMSADEFKQECERQVRMVRLMLAPKYMHGAFPADVELYDIFGDKVEDRSKLGDDTRFGYLSYGVLSV